MTKPIIATPRGYIYTDSNSRAELVWNADFQPKWQKRFSKAQIFMDSEVLRLCEPFVPLRTSMLIKSGILGTEIGSGTVSYIAPYARAQYYLRRKHKNDFGSQRGSLWFERMKAIYGRRLLETARNIAEGEE